MKKVLLLSLLVILGAAGLRAQNENEVYTAIPLGNNPAETPKEVFKPYLSLGGGLSFAVINNRKEVRGLYKPGIHAGMMYHTSRWFALSADFTQFFRHNSSPAFVDISAWNTEVNGNLLMDIGQTNLRFKAMFGLSYLNWLATYIGPSLRDKNTWYYGMPIRQEWIAANLGCGVMQDINPRLTLAFDFRTRFASEDLDLIGISDTAFMAGLYWRPQRLNKKEEQPDNSARRKTTTGRSPRQYKWLKKRQ